MNRIDQYKNPSDHTHRDPETLEEEITDTRHRMDNTIEKLGEKLDPREYISAAGDWAERNIELDDISAKIASFGNGVTSGIKNNPIPTALVGAAALMLLIPKRSKQKQEQPGQRESDPEAGRYNHPHRNNVAMNQTDAHNGSSESCDSNAVWDSLSEIPDKATAMVRNAGHIVAEKTRAGGEAISNTSKSLAQKTGETAHNSRKRFERGTQDSPALIGAGALALGFIAAIALPRTRKEDEICGEASDQLKTRIKGEIDDATPSLEEIKDSSINALDSLADRACDQLDEKIAPQ